MNSECIVNCVTVVIKSMLKTSQSHQDLIGYFIFKNRDYGHEIRGIRTQQPCTLHLSILDTHQPIIFAILLALSSFIGNMYEVGLLGPTSHYEGFNSFTVF